MTVNSLTSSAEFATDGVNRLFPFYFKFLDKKDLVVGFVNSAGVGTTLALNVDYTVTGEGDEAGGKITTTVAPAALGRLVVTRKMEATQKTALRNQGRFFAEVHETVFDRLTMLLQQAMAMASRALRTSAFEPDGIDPLPLVARRANKLLAFDVGGQPIASNLSLDSLEQQPALALASATAAKASADNAEAAASSASGSASSANASRIAAAGSASAAAGSAQSAADAGLQLGMSAWGHRPQPFKGFALDDGQELERALYPDFVAMLDAGLLPIATEAQWQANPNLRGHFVSLSSPGKFRMRDLNGMSAGSFPASFLRGGGVGQGGQIKMDQMQDFDIGLSTAAGGSQVAASASSAVNQKGDSISYPGAKFSKVAGTAGIPRFGSETFPTHAVGAWMTRLYGLITPLGSAEASSLATAYASMASRVGALEGTVSTIKRQSINLPASTSLFNSVIHSLGEAPWRYSFVGFLTQAVGQWPAGTRIDMGGLAGEVNYVHGLMVVNANATSFSYKCANSGFAMPILNSGGAREWLRFDQVNIVALISTY